MSIEVSVIALIIASVSAVALSGLVWMLMRLELRMDAKARELQQQIETLDEAVSTLMEVAGVGKERDTR